LPLVCVSAHTGVGIEDLQSAILSAFQASAGESGETTLLSDQRHYQALLGAQAAILAYLHELQAGSSPEFLAVELRTALAALGEITGETASEDILERIFSRFCIGK
jgi:tRNA modification GTPase